MAGTGGEMKGLVSLLYKTILVLLAPQFALGQWSETQEGRLVIRGGWLFDGVSDERRRNTGIVIRDGEIVETDADVQKQVLITAGVVDLLESDTILPGMIESAQRRNAANDRSDAGA
jgi:hypothetical protein